MDISLRYVHLPGRSHLEVGWEVATSATEEHEGDPEREKKKNKQTKKEDLNKEG